MIMYQFIGTIIIASLIFGAYSALAEDKTSSKDAMGGLTQNQTIAQLSDTKKAPPATLAKSAIAEMVIEQSKPIVAPL